MTGVATGLECVDFVNVIDLTCAPAIRVNLVALRTVTVVLPLQFEQAERPREAGSRAASWVSAGMGVEVTAFEGRRAVATFVLPGDATGASPLIRRYTDVS